MMKKKKRKKIQTLGKVYRLENSGLYRLPFLSKLFSLLKVNEKQASMLFKNSDCYYDNFLIENRKIQAPIIDSYLDIVQNRLASLINRIATPDYLFSAKGKSFILNAKQHISGQVKLSIDISKFYPSTSKYAVFKFFRNKLECSHKVSDYLAEICTVNGHLPTGSQLSSSLAFFSNLDMFEKLHSLSLRNNLKMTVYVDDITFSGEVIPKGFLHKVESIINSSKLSIAKQKTRTSKNGSPIEITGVVITNNRACIPNRSMQKLHQQLDEWKEVIKIRDNFDIVKCKYIKLISLINYIINVNSDYSQLKSKIRQEYIQYKKLQNNSN